MVYIGVYGAMGGVVISRVGKVIVGRGGCTDPYDILEGFLKDPKLVLQSHCIHLPHPQILNVLHMIWYTTMASSNTRGWVELMLH